MHRPLPPLNALRAFEAAARHASMARAADELHVTPGALSHQIRALEEMLGVALFDRGVRSISLTAAGAALYPGLRTAFEQMRAAVEALAPRRDERILVVSTVPGLTAKWLAPRLHRFAAAHPEIDVRISSSTSLANFTTDGVHVALRNLKTDAAVDGALMVEPLMRLSYAPVCAPKFIVGPGPRPSADILRGLPLIHDESLSVWGQEIGWAEWLARAGVTEVDLSRGLRFSSADHALEAAVEGAGVVLASDVLAFDDLRTGRLVMPFDLKLATNRAYCFVCPRDFAERPNVRAFRAWIREESAAFR